MNTKDRKENQFVLIEFSEEQQAFNFNLDGADKTAPSYMPIAWLPHLDAVRWTQEMKNLRADHRLTLEEVVERELQRCKHELETLTDDSAEIITDVPEAGKDTPDLSMAAMAASFELDKPRKVSWKDNAVRTIDRMISWMLYSMTFCFLLGVAGLDLSARELIAYSLMLGLVTGSINNIERVMKELSNKED